MNKVKNLGNKILKEEIINKIQKVSPKLISLLEEAMLNDCTFEEAALYAKISRSGLYNIFKAYPEFKQYLNNLRDYTVILARKTVIDKIRSGDIATAKWYLERKRPKEFSQKVSPQLQFQSKVIHSYLPDVDQNIKDGQSIVTGKIAL